MHARWRCLSTRVIHVGVRLLMEVRRQRLQLELADLVKRTLHSVLVIGATSTELCPTPRPKVIHESLVHASVRILVIEVIVVHGLL